MSAKLYDGKKENAVGEIILPEGITEIKDSEFSDCNKLESVILPDSLISIGWGAFKDCTALKEISIPDNDKVFIGLGHFKNCPDDSKILSSKFWDSVCVKTLKDFRNLKEITLPDGLASIGDLAFWNYRSLTEIKLSDGLTSIGEDAFNNCPALKKNNVS